MDREQLLADIQNYKARRAALGNFDDGWLEFEKSERKQAEAMGDAALKAALDSAHAEVNQSGGELVRRRFKITREVFAARAEWFSIGMSEKGRDLPAAAPEVLKNAIGRMEKEIEFRRGIGIEEIYFSGAPGSTGLTSSRKRTPADEVATVRAEQALAKLQKLIEVAGDPTQAIRDTISELREADLGAVWTQPEAKPEREPLRQQGNPRRFAVAISDGVAAEIEPE